MKADKLDPIRLGFAMGVLWSLSLLGLGLLATYYNYAEAFVISIGAVYPGYDNTLMGSLIGGLWGAVDGFIGAWLLAQLYNLTAHPHETGEEKKHPKHKEEMHEKGWLPEEGRKKAKK